MAKYIDLSIDGTSMQTATDAGFNNVGANGMKITEISDSAVVNEASLNKMATSIPTPFARLYLYDTAFAELNALEGKDPGNAYICGEGDKATLYHHLVSECFDMLEFIFEYGADPRFTITEWDVKADTALLGATDATPGDVIIDDDIYGGARQPVNEIEVRHKRLGLALRDAIINTSLKASNKIFIFKWDKEIIGGTSPFTLVYTSPNWRKKMNVRKLKFYGGLGNLLFPPIDPTTKVKALRERSKEFRMYMYALVQKYAQAFTLGRENGGTLSNLYAYISNTIDNYETQGTAKTVALREFEQMRDNGFAQGFADNYKDLKFTSTEGATADRPLTATPPSAGPIQFYTKIVKPDTDSAYIIRPTVAKLPVETNRGGQKINMADCLPLVLSERTLGPGAKYWYRTPYNPSTLPAKPEGQYFERTLPGVAGNPEYPYLTESDFLEDSIMWLGYEIDSKNFFTGYDGACGFLLPLKPTFFKYFDLKDLATMVKVTPEPFPICPKVTVTIEIPVAGGYVSFSKTYDRSQPGQYIDFPKDGSIKLGIFPFYTYAGTTAANDDAYKVLLARMSDVQLDFYNEDFVKPLGAGVVKNRIRTQSEKRVTEYYTVGTHLGQGGPGTFRVIRVLKNGIGGMIVPKFRQAKVSTDKYVFCVDFGTANTNVAYAKATPVTAPNGAPELRVTDQEIKTLEYNENESQVAMLNVEGSEGMANDLNQFIDSEFVPKAIGHGEIKFPTRTIACTRTDTIVGDPQLFGDTNIAFYTDKYGNNRGYRYQTELKWGQASRKLNGAFFRELLWMCKNKVAELGGDPVFEFYYTYPQTMSSITPMMKGWAEAAQAIRTQAHVFDIHVRAANGRRLQLYEGIAPWYRAISIPENEVFTTDDFLNIDIGGGSTDAIYITRGHGNAASREVQGYSFSAKFAANDLWGDGVSGSADFTSGFLNFFENSVKPTLDLKLQHEYDDYRSRATGSADMISYLFSHPRFDFAENLETDSKLRIPILMHFAATIYYVARTLAIQQLALPKHISFSGMGSLYLKFLTEDSDILSDIIKSIFNFVGLKVVDKSGRARSLTARFTKNPKKITAEGGVLMFNTTRSGLTDKVVKSEELNFHLYQGEEDEEESQDITVGTLEKFKEPAVAEVEEFLKLFEFPAFRQTVAKLEGDYPKFDIDTVKDNLTVGYDLALTAEYPSAEGDTPVKDVLFFWPLKHAIYMLARDMAKLSISTRGRNAE